MFARPRSRRNPVSRLLALAVIFSLVAGSLLPIAAMAKPGKSSGLIRAEGFSLVGPLGNMLSASSWTMVSGMDPRVVTRNASRSVAMGWSLGATGLASSSGGWDMSTATQQVPFRNPSPAFSRNLLVTRQVGLFPIQTEPHIEVNPNDPLHLVLGVIDYNFPSMSTYVSFDGGETWDGPNQVRFFRNDYTAAGDPVLTFDRDGTVYLTSISLGFKEFDLGNIGSGSEVSSMVVARSYDGGLTWGDPVSAARSSIETESVVDEEGRERGTATIGFLDKPWLATGPNPADPSKDSIYLTYTDFETTYGLMYSDEIPYLSSPFTQTTIRMVRSDDGGVTWTDPIDISPTVLSGTVEGEGGEGAGLAGISKTVTNAPVIGEGLAMLSAAVNGGSPLTAAEIARAEDFARQDSLQQEEADSGNLESDRTVQGSQPAVMPDGTLVVAYVDTTNDGVQKGLSTIRVVVSKDGGATFTSPMIAGVTREVRSRPRNAFFRMWGSAFPQLAVGPNNEIYIAVIGLPQQQPTDDGDVLLMRSMDGGGTWETPNRVNQDATDRLQFYPSIDVSPNGVLHVMWADMRDDPMEARYHVYYTKSDDQGATFGFSLPEQNYTSPDTVVTDFASNSLRGFPQGLFLGDYFSIAATNDDAYLVWPDTRLGEYGGPNQQIAFARKTALPQPELFLSPPNGSAGRTVTVQGFGFNPDSEVLMDIGGNLIANLMTDELGGFTTTVAMPVTGEGAIEFRAFDETGNRAIASFYVDFGFDNVQESLTSIEARLGEGATGTPGPSGTLTAQVSPLDAARSFSVWLGAAAGIVVAAVGGYVLAKRRAHP